MAQATFGVTRMRLERLGDERARTSEKIQDLLALAEEEQRDLADYEQEQVNKYRSRVVELEDEILALATDIERAEGAKDISRLVRGEGDEGGGEGGGDGDGKTRRWATPRSDGPVVYRNFAEYARDQLIVRYPAIAEQAAGPHGSGLALRDEAQERISRALQATTSTTVAGLVPPQHLAQIMDIIDGSRPVVASGRPVPLDRGSLTYPKITGRPEVTLQASEKTEGGTVNMDVDLETLAASTFIGAGNLSWQAINWSTPDALQLWFDLAAEAYARQTEEHACDALEDASAGTLGTTAGRLGTAGTESFAQWRSAVIGGIAAIYSTTGGRARTDTLYLSAARFFQLAALGTDETLQISGVGGLNVGAMTGTFSGLRVVGSYAFDQDVAIVGDSAAFLVGETAGAPVQMRAVEPSIGGMEVGVIGAFASAVFDAERFLHLSTHL